MAVSFLTTDDVDAVIGEDVRIALFSETGTYSSDKFDRLSELSSTFARSAMLSAGYRVNDNGDVDDMTKNVTLAVLVRLAYGRRQQEPPPDIIAILTPMANMIISGDLPLPDRAPSIEGAVGGHAWSDTGALPPRIKDLRRLM